MHRSWLQKTIAFLSVTLLGLLVFVIFSHMRPVISGIWDLIGRLILIALLFVLTLFFRVKERFRSYQPIIMAFFISAFAMAVDMYLPTSTWIRDLTDVSIETPLGIAIDKLDSSIIIVLSILIWSRILGKNCSDLFLCGGAWKKSLLIGIIAFSLPAIAAYFIALLFGASPYSLLTFLGWLPFILIFIAGNAFNEELLFRGQFLRANEQVMPKFLANLAIAIPFVLHHTGITYTNDVLMFLIFLFPLALAWGDIMQKTNSIWGSFLFHAGMDIPVVIALFSSLPR